MLNPFFLYHVDFELYLIIEKLTIPSTSIKIHFFSFFHQLLEPYVTLYLEDFVERNCFYGLKMMKELYIRHLFFTYITFFETYYTSLYI